MPGGSFLVAMAAIASWLFGVWVFFPLFALETASAGSGTWQTQLRKIPRNLLFFWAFFAFWRLCLFIVPAPALLQFIPEPINTSVFLWAGAGSLALWLVVAFEGRRHVAEGAGNAGRSRRAVAYPRGASLRGTSAVGVSSRAR
jgi:hypothetical protein